MVFEKGYELKTFNRLYRELNEIYHKIALKQNVSDSAFMILYALTEIGDNCLQKDICKYFSISKQTINSSIKKLEKQGLLELKSTNNKCVQIILTPKGLQLIKENILPIIKIEKNTFEEIGQKDCKELLRLTKKYKDTFNKKINEVI